MKKTFVAAIVVILIILCYKFVPFRSIGPLGDNYYYLSPYEAMDVGFPGGSIVYKSFQEYAYEKIIIEGQVNAIGYDDDFIVALQQKAQPGGKDRLGYFIIQKKTDAVTGPLDQRAYLLARERLGVPEDLELKKQKTYDSWPPK